MPWLDEKVLTSYNRTSDNFHLWRALDNVSNIQYNICYHFSNTGKIIRDSYWNLNQSYFPLCKSFDYYWIWKKAFYHSLYHSNENFLYLRHYTSKWKYALRFYRLNWCSLIQYSLSFKVIRFALSKLLMNIKEPGSGLQCTRKREFYVIWIDILLSSMKKDLIRNNVLDTNNLTDKIYCTYIF